MRISRFPVPGPKVGLAGYLTSVVTAAAMIIGALALTGCSSSKQDPFAGTGSPMWKGAGPMPKGGGRYHVGKPYSVAGKMFYPKEDPDYDETGTASWYGPKFHKRMTSNGEWYDMEYRSAAHPTLPIPSYAKVTNLENGRRLIVRINDRGPFVGTRIIDMSKKSAEILDFKAKGKAQVRVQYIGPAPLNDKGTHLAAMNDALDRGTPLHSMIAETNRSDGRTSTKVAVNKPVQPVYPQSAAGSGSGDFYIQVAAFSDESNAHRAQSALNGYAATTITPVSASVGTIHRVRMGPLQSAETAHSVLNNVIDAGYHDARVIQLSQY